MSAEVGAPLFVDQLLHHVFPPFNDQSAAPDVRNASNQGYSVSLRDFSSEQLAAVAHGLARMGEHGHGDYSESTEKYGPFCEAFLDGIMDRLERQPVQVLASFGL